MCWLLKCRSFMLTILQQFNTGMVLTPELCIFNEMAGVHGNKGERRPAINLPVREAQGSMTCALM